MQHPIRNLLSQHTAGSSCSSATGLPEADDITLDYCWRCDAQGGGSVVGGCVASSATMFYVLNELACAQSSQRY
jgi:hypothetical protein